MYIFENDLDKAEKLLDELHLLEQFNEEIFIQKANVLSRRDKHQQALNSSSRLLNSQKNPLKYAL